MKLSWNLGGDIGFEARLKIQKTSITSAEFLKAFIGIKNYIKQVQQKPAPSSRGAFQMVPTKGCQITFSLAVF